MLTRRIGNRQWQTVSAKACPDQLFRSVRHVGGQHRVLSNGVKVSLGYA
jgi:hypothetical protein